jgi:hypothetical protein
MLWTQIKIFGTHANDFETLKKNRFSSRKIENKCQKRLEDFVLEETKHYLNSFLIFFTQETLGCIGMNATCTHNLLFNLEKQTTFSYTILPVKKINVGRNLRLWENCYLIILSIHILKLEISGCDKSTPLKGISSWDSKKASKRQGFISNSFHILQQYHSSHITEKLFKPNLYQHH